MRKFSPPPGFDPRNVKPVVMYINSTDIPPIMIINRIYEHQKPSVVVACFLPGRAKYLSAPLYNYFSLSLQRHYSPGWASASFKSFLHPSRFRATTVQFLHPNLAASSFTPSSQRSLGLPLGRFPPGSLRRTLLDKSSSSWRMTHPAHLNLLSLQNFTMSFSPHNCIIVQLLASK